MAEYIERDEAIRKAIDACIKVVGHGISHIDAVDIAEIMDSILAADAVEVVRCKDCENYKPYKKPVEDFDGCCIVRECEIDENDFCS